MERGLFGKEKNWKPKDSFFLGNELSDHEVIPKGVKIKHRPTSIDRFIFAEV